jgi:predicted dehydrogenase
MSVDASKLHIMSTQGNLKCGVVGVGYLGQHHARIYSTLPGVDLVGVCDSSPERAREIADKFGCRVFESPEELGAACDAVSVVVPTDLHRDVAVPLLKSGCHMLIEKPLCTSLEEASDILNAANEANVVVQVGHIEHYNPVMGFMEKAVQSPRFITADRLAPFQPRGTEVGVVLDLMIHDIGVILQLVNSPVERVESIGVNVLSRTEDIANARIVFENGCVANINTSRVSEKKIREIRVFQPQGYLSIDFMNQSGHVLTMSEKGLSKEEIPIEKDEPLKLELASFVNCVRTHADPKVGAALGKTALEVAIKITDQIRKGMAETAAQ